MYVYSRFGGENSNLLNKMIQSGMKKCTQFYKYDSCLWNYEAPEWQFNVLHMAGKCTDILCIHTDFRQNTSFSKNEN